jgi:hypothetical protein
LELIDRGRRGPGAREDRTRFVRGGTRTDAPSLDGMTEKTDKTRDSPLSIRIPPDRQEEFRHNVAVSGLPTNAYVVRAIFNAPIPRGARHTPAEKEMLAHLLGRSAAIRDALDNATRVAGDDKRTAEAAEAAYAELKVIAAALMKMMERTP